MQLLMPRPSLAVLLSFILERIQMHPFRLSEYYKKWVWTSPKQLCRILIGKQIMYKLQVQCTKFVQGAPRTKAAVPAAIPDLAAAVPEGGPERRLV